MIRFFLVILGVVGGLFGAVWFVQTPLFNRLSDRTPPEILMPSDVVALGTSPQPFRVLVTDNGVSGADLRAVLKQGVKEAACQVVPAEVIDKALEDLREKSRARGESFAPFGVRCDPIEAALVAGRATVTLASSDRSFWSNSAEKAFAVELDFAPPEIEVLTVQHMVKTGGSEVVLFRLQDSSAVTGSVRVGGLQFSAVSVRAIDPTFPELLPTFIAVFALPLDWDASQVIRVHASDSAGNVSEAPLRFRVEAASRNADDITLSRDFIESRVQPLVAEYELFLKQQGTPEATDLIRAIPGPEDLEGRFRLVNEQFRSLLDQELAKVLSRVTPERLWQGVFVRPMAAKLSSNFGDKRSYFFEDKLFGGSFHNGFDLASTERDLVRATNEGIVRLAQSFGLYGNTIVVDHGLGVFSLYGHLSVSQVKVGDRVLKGDIIGRTGMTGFAGGDHLHFEIRVGGVSVSPVEWWDPKWYQDDVEGKIAAAKTRL